MLGGDTERVGRDTSLARLPARRTRSSRRQFATAPLTSELDSAPGVSWSDRESSHDLVRIIAQPLTAVLAKGEPAR